MSDSPSSHRTDNGLVIRAYRPAPDDDIRAVTAIYTHHVLHGTASYETEAPSLEDMAARFGQLQAHHYPIMIAERDGIILGYAYAGPHKPRNGYRYTVEDSVYVAPDALHQGIGTALLTALIAAAREQGYRQMMAVIGGPVDGSVALHRSLGFREIGRAYELGFKFGQWLDTIYMQLPLQPDAKSD